MSRSVVAANDEVGMTKERERHPSGLYILFASEMWERFGFYTAAAIMTLYLQARRLRLVRNQRNKTLVILSNVHLCHATGRGVAGRQVPGVSPVGASGWNPVRGGLRLTRDGILCDLLSCSGLLFAGNGFFKPNISTMVGNLYPASSPLKDSAYSIFYMGINIGALLSPIVAEARFRHSRVLTCSKWRRRVKRCRPIRPQACDRVFSQLFMPLRRG